MARTVGDVARMLSVMAGPTTARRSPTTSMPGASRPRSSGPPEGWRAAWTPDLNGLIPVDHEVAAVAERATGVFRALGVRVERACPDFGEVNDIVLATRGLSMVARHAEKLARWEPVMQRGLVWNIKQGLSLTPEQIGRGEILRTRLWHRVRAFMETRDLLLLPTVAVPPFPVEQPYPTEINGKALDNYTQWFFLTYGITVTGLAVHPRSPAASPGAGCRWACRSWAGGSGGRGAAGRRRVRGRSALGGRRPAGGDGRLTAHWMPIPTAKTFMMNDRSRFAASALPELRLLVALLPTVRVPRLGDDLSRPHVDLGALAPPLVAKGQGAVVGCVSPIALISPLSYQARIGPRGVPSTKAISKLRRPLG